MYIVLVFGRKGWGKHIKADNGIEYTYPLESSLLRIFGKSTPGNEDSRQGSRKLEMISRLFT